MNHMDLYRQGGETYYIKNKDKILCYFHWDDELAVLDDDICAPKFISVSLTSWLESRIPPKHREHIESLLGQCGLETTRDVIDFAKGLSLTDTFWVTKNIDEKWDSVSLFKNRFDEIITRIALDGGLHGLIFPTISPEFGTNGMLAKCWVREDNGDINLYKAGTECYSNAGMEPYSEVMASQILDRLNYNHVKYNLKRFRGKLISYCKLFTSEEIMFHPIFRVCNPNTIEELISYCKEKHFEKALAEHLIIDYLIANNDRHLNNFGVLRDSDNYKVLGFAPIFDCGAGMLAYWSDCQSINEYMMQMNPKFYSSFELGVKYAKQLVGNKHNVNKLVGFKFNREELGNFPEDRLIVLEKWLQDRVKKFLDI